MSANALVNAVLSILKDGIFPTAEQCKEHGYIESLKLPPEKMFVRRVDLRDHS
jgi:hypothetical protein